MDIYNILKQNIDTILKEDIEFFEIELSTGNYESEYRNKCLDLISQIKRFKFNSSNIANVIKKEENENANDLDLLNIGNSLTNTKIDDELSNDKQFKTLIEQVRNAKSYKANFIKIITNNPINETYVENNFSFFKVVEINELLKIMKFSEKFLENHINLLNCKNIAQYQIFSETFFMKHFGKLNYKIVFKNNQNSWILPENRSSKLTVFLKLKGITI